MRSLTPIVLLVVSCGGNVSTATDGGYPQCDPAYFRLCEIPDPPLPPEFAPWHCTDGAALGRAWCAVCTPAETLYCQVTGSAIPVVCVPTCAQCQVPGWPQCRPAPTDDMGGPLDMAGWSQ